MDPSRYGSSAGQSSSSNPTGFYRGVVKAVDGDTVTVQVPRLFGGAQIPDVPVAGPALVVDDPVYVSFIEGRRGSLLAFASSGAAAVGDITAVTAGTNLNGGGASGDVTVNLDDDISLTSVTANLYGPVHLTVKNTSGGTLAKMTAVYATGSVGASGAVEVQASDNSVASTMPALGLLDEELDSGEVGSATVFGVIRLVDTDTPGWAANDSLYINGSGALQNTRPTSGLIQKIGRVVRVHASTGEILVMGAGRTNDTPHPIYADSTGTRVGINDLNPSYTLDVTGVINATTNVQAPKLNGDLIGPWSGDDLGIGAGETVNYMSGNISGEHLWLGAENNIYLVKSPDNWASGWAGRYETRLTPLSDGSLQIGTAYGNIEIGPKNSSWCHIYTDRGAFYFDEEINMGGGSTVRGNLTVNDWAGFNASPTTNIPVRAYQGTLTYASNDTTAYRAEGNWGGAYGFAEGSGRAMMISPGGNTWELYVGGTSSSWGTLAIGVNSSGSVNVPGALSKGSGSFRIPHPLPALSGTHDLVHSFVEAPQADNIYRGKATLVAGASESTVSVNIDTAAGMTDGTFVLLNRDVQAFTSNEDSPCGVYSSISGNVLTITGEHADCDHVVSWMVIGERQDQHMYDTAWTDVDGRVIVEPAHVETDYAALQAGYDA